jgi:hypothetical protein
MSSKKRPNTKQVKQQLFLKCGRVDMYSMEEYAKCKLELHHDPPFRYTYHTIYDESYLLSADNHRELHYIEQNNPEEYERRMEVIKENKKILERKRSSH